MRRILTGVVAIAAISAATLDTPADDIPQAPYNQPNWVKHVDEPAGTTAGQYITDRFWEKDFNDGTDQANQQHHLVAQFHNFSTSNNTIKVKYKIKRPGGVEKIKDVGQFILPPLSDPVMAAFIYDERDILKNSSDTGKLRLKVRFGNNVEQVGFGVIVAEDPPCPIEPQLQSGGCSPPECCPPTVAEDPEPADPQNYIEFQLVDVAVAPGSSMVSRITLAVLLLTASLFMLIRWRRDQGVSPLNG